ncbi:MAG TPA: hypothetical protein PKJ77_02020 [Thermodesulfobacteriota bacterium]|nr:hypothetical protein [Deltaproteobacteria bacterium]HNR14356.1 hypothetical protein [Thermodesulfobacteriota bacterium]HNU73064.1 hypothetical protein [Thermodesulfobacteriota bacterium]HOC38034.1 hypothetical protein [Thermodesulfobacteriota bacterium]
MQNTYNALADMTRLVWMIDRYRRIRFIVLFFSLLLSIALVPILGNMGFRVAIEVVEAFIGAILLTALFSIVGKHSFYLIGSLFLPLVTISSLRSLLITKPLLPAADIPWIILASVSIVLIFRHIMKAKAVTVDMICAALSVYLLFGLIFGVIYFVLEQLRPGSLFSPYLMGGEHT